MLPESLINYFTPPHLQNRVSPQYDQVRTVITGMLVAAILLAVLPIPLFFFFQQTVLYYFILLACIVSLFVIRKTANYMAPTLATFIISYGVLTYISLISGGIYSIHITNLYLLMLTGFWADRQIGHWMIFVNIASLVLVYLVTNDNKYYDSTLYSISSKEYSLLFHVCLTLFFGAFFSFVQHSHEAARAQIRKKQLLEISSLSKLVKKRNKELMTMRQNLASDFHDDTGNLLASISQQASVLRVRLGKEDPTLLPILDSIVENCDNLYSSSRDFLWSVNNDSDNPMVLFYHLVDFGQNFYNQFDIAFSATPLEKSYFHLLKMAPFASRNLIFIFKEAMTNAAKHSGATHITLKMIIFNEYVKISLKDNGRWKIPDVTASQNGLRNMQKRCRKNDFLFNHFHSDEGTTVEVYVPITFTNPSVTNKTNQL